MNMQHWVIYRDDEPYMLIWMDDHALNLYLAGLRQKYPWRVWDAETVEANEAGE